MEVTLEMLITTCLLIFLAGFIDSIGGGGGLISLPAYLFAGLPMHNAIASNKFSSTFGTAVSTFRFIKSKNTHIKSAVFSVIGALIGSFIGANLALAIDEIYLKYLLVILLPFIAFIVLTKKNFGEKDNTSGISNIKIIVLSTLSGLLIGAYDGFFGPGTGMFLILVNTGVIGFDIKTSSGNAKIVNLASNISALATFWASGKVLFPLAIPAALFGILGNWLGSGLAIKKGAKVIKPITVLIMMILLVRVISDLVSASAA
ncbi:MAG TPA: TSUP family transporter [Clostridiaceae bacterium]|nr:TSUP family transporter [Clostridiaceae bacterium]